MAIIKDAKLSPEFCQDVLARWLKEELGLQAGQAKLLDIQSRLWIEFSPLYLEETGEIAEFDAFRGVLWHKIPEDLSASFPATNTLVLTLYASDPTPRSAVSGNIYRSDSSLSSFSVAITIFRGSLIANTVRMPPSGWGVTLNWPFEP